MPLAALLFWSIGTGVAASASSDYQVRSSCQGHARCFTRVQAALDAAERDLSPGWVRIRIAPGEYREKLILRRNRLRLIGAGAQRTRLHFDAVAEHSGHYDRDGWGTAGSATLTITAQDVNISNLSVENRFDYPANRALSTNDPGKISASQALAVQLDSDSDRIVFDHVSLLGYHDTFFTRGKRALFRNGLIAGNVDFIFGSGMLLIEDSIIRSRPRDRGKGAEGFEGFITAPSTPIGQAIGIVIYRSRLTREDGVPDGSVALGRPWHPTKSFADGRYADPDAIGQASFIDCIMQAHIHPDGWTSMAGTAPDGSKTRIFTPQDSRFHEAGSTGPGSRRRGNDRTWSDRATIAEVRKIIFAEWTP